MMKRIFGLVFALLLVAGVALAVPPTNPGEGWYQHPVTGETKYFEQGHMIQLNDSKDWKFCGTAPCVPQTNPINLQTVTVRSIANPVFNDIGNLPFGNANSGGWGVGAGAVIDVIAYAQGTKSADATAFATGSAFGTGYAFGIQGDHFGFGSSGAIAGVYVLGAGYGLGIDNLSFTKNPDYASVGISYSGGVNQGNGIGITNGLGTFAGGSNNTGATFSGSSFNESFGKIWILDIGIPALAVGADGAGALAGGFTIASYVDQHNFASAGAFTFGFSGYSGDSGTVYGSGQVQHQAVAGDGSGGSIGISYGSASFNYEGTGNVGSGSAQTGGWTSINNGSGSSTVTSYSSSSAHASK